MKHARKFGLAAGLERDPIGQNRIMLHYLLFCAFSESADDAICFENALVQLPLPRGGLDYTLKARADFVRHVGWPELFLQTEILAAIRIAEVGKDAEVRKAHHV